ncbi:hypothetical protein ROZALSC1DRAFT_27742 [Rozella allomycis CSF55]|uniref:Uncharacterized protein n=1 Tax=Rozella allomycis (strain CSF55) TaxID=988480 RepID=A0A075B0B9_ROZAC|nr:hypothetical protein O9G_002667 [Rozella allomycis CSF55]RKP20808.1 hypothetical protein ROZALSC1DRAFT_27742 [Rozella allomycis CSF55]|eukprot:EPZ36024.1 hypothetical protein O9G_002667 [Rozella allomycis CSF55]
MWKPSKSLLLVCAGVTGITGPAYYNSYLREKIKSGQVKHYSMLPIKYYEKSESIDVYFGDGDTDQKRRNRRLFRKYARPILNAAALEFEIVEKVNIERPLMDFSTKEGQSFLQSEGKFVLPEFPFTPFLSRLFTDVKKFILID